MSHSPKASKNGSTDGDKADAKQDTQDGDDDDYDDDGEVSQDEASKSIQEDQGTKIHFLLIYSQKHLALCLITSCSSIWIHVIWKYIIW